MTALLVVGGLLVLLVGGEAFVRGAVGAGRRMGMPPFLVGTIIVGFGTSAPELLVAVNASLSGVPALAVGNVFGSNIANILLILPIAALVRPVVSGRERLVAEGVVLIAVAAAIVLLGFQSPVPRWQGPVMITALAGLVTFQYVRASRRIRLRLLLKRNLILAEEVPQRRLVSLMLLASGLFGLLLGADLLVEGAVRAARHFGVTEALIGLTVVAIGTSVPELASIAIASWRGHTELAFGSVLGSNLFNSLGILGAAVMIGDVRYPPLALSVDGPAGVAAMAILLGILSGRLHLGWAQSVALLGAYVAYLAARILLAQTS